jgi:hypothetical protein
MCRQALRLQVSAGCGKQRLVARPDHSNLPAGKALLPLNRLPSQSCGIDRTLEVDIRTAGQTRRPLRKSPRETERIGSPICDRIPRMTSMQDRSPPDRVVFTNPGGTHSRQLPGKSAYRRSGPTGDMAQTTCRCGRSGVTSMEPGALTTILSGEEHPIAASSRECPSGCGYPPSFRPPDDQ